MKISSQPFSKKPTNIETGSIVNEIANIEYDVIPTLDELARVIENGQTLAIDNFIGRNKKENFVSTQFIGIDMDIDSKMIEGNLDKHQNTINYFKQDDVFTRTGEILNENGYDWYIRYKTFNYSDEYPKHRYLLKFKHELTETEALTVYRAISSILPVDGNTTKNLCRLWFGSSTLLGLEDMQGLELDYDSFDFSDIKEEMKQSSKSTKSINKDGSVIGLVDLKANFNYINPHNFNYDTYLTHILDTHDNWNHETVFESIFSVAIIMAKVFNNHKPIELFLDNVKLSSTKDRRSDYSIQFNHNIASEKTYTPKPAIKMLEQLTDGLVSKFNNTFDIFKPLKGECSKTHLNARQEPFINSDDISTMKGLNLLVAPPGSGKTRSIVDYALEVSDKLCVLVIPLIVIMEKLEADLTEEQNKHIVFLHSKKENKESYTDKKLLILTPEQYYNQFSGNENSNSELYIDFELFIDEAHEILQYWSIDGTLGINTGKFKSSSIDYLLNTPRPQTTFVTATPFNLARKFDNVSWFTKTANKRIEFIETDNFIEEISNLFEATTNITEVKTLIYINSHKRLQRYMEQLQELFPDLTMSSVTGDKKTANIEDEALLVANIKPETNIIFATKYLNVGIDLQNIFNHVIYAHETLDINSCLQLSNRERGVDCKYTILHSPNTRDILIDNSNSGYLNHNLGILDNTELTDEQKDAYERFSYRGELSEHIYQDNMVYSKLLVSAEFMGTIFEQMYDNINIIFSKSFNLVEEDKPKVKRDMGTLIKEYRRLTTEQFIDLGYDYVNYKGKDSVMLSPLYGNDDEITLFKAMVSSGMRGLSYFEYMLLLKHVNGTFYSAQNYIDLTDEQKSDKFIAKMYRIMNNILKLKFDYDETIDFGYEKQLILTIRELNNMDLYYSSDELHLQKATREDNTSYKTCLEILKLASTLDEKERKKLAKTFNDSKFWINSKQWTDKPAEFIQYSAMFGYYYESKKKKYTKEEQASMKKRRVKVKKTYHELLNKTVTIADLAEDLQG